MATSEQWRALIQHYFPPEQWDNAYQVMMAESGGNPNAANDQVPQRERSFGLFQINTNVHPLTREQAMDPETNIRYAAQLYSQQGWRPWSAAQQLGLVGSPGKPPGQAAPVVQAGGATVPTPRPRPDPNGVASETTTLVQSKKPGQPPRYATRRVYNDGRVQMWENVQGTADWTEVPLGKDDATDPGQTLKYKNDLAAWDDEQAAAKAAQPQYDTWTDPATGIVYKVDSRTKEKVGVMSEGKGSSPEETEYKKAQTAQLQAQTAKILAELQDPGLSPEERALKKAQIAHINAQIAKLQEPPGPNPYTSLTIAEQAQAKHDALWARVGVDLTAQEAISNFDEWWKVNVELPSVKHRIGKETVDQYLATIPYRVGPGFAGKAAQAVNSIGGQGAAPQWEAADFQFQMPDFGQMADEAVRRLMGEQGGGTAGGGVATGGPSQGGGSAGAAMGPGPLSQPIPAGASATPDYRPPALPYGVTTAPTMPTAPGMPTVPGVPADLLQTLYPPYRPPRR